MTGIELFLYFSLAITMGQTSDAKTDAEDFLSRTAVVDGKSYGYRVYVPKNLKTKKNLPVLLFLHGAGERGDDNLAQTKIGLGPAIVKNRESFPFVVVMPQCPKGRWWPEPEMQAIAMKALEDAVKEFKGNTSRIYLTGLSMGGYGAWGIVRGNPRKFAALAIICGGITNPRSVPVPAGAQESSSSEDPYVSTARKVGRTPVWVFHGSADMVVPVTESRKMVEAIKAAGGKVRYSEYEGVTHNSWDRAYGEPELFTWLLSHRK
jgi:predicted peptidase